MVTVEYYGLYRIEYKTQKEQFEAATISDLLTAIAEKHDNHTAKELRNAVMFVNDVNIVRLSLFKTKLKDGDVVFIMSPASGG